MNNIWGWPANEVEAYLVGDKVTTKITRRKMRMASFCCVIILHNFNLLNWLTLAKHIINPSRNIVSLDVWHVLICVLAKFSRASTPSSLWQVFDANRWRVIPYNASVNHGRHLSVWTSRDLPEMTHTRRYGLSYKSDQEAGHTWSVVHILCWCSNAKYSTVQYMLEQTVCELACKERKQFN